MTYDLEEAYLEDVVEDARTLPFFGERKVLLIKSPLFLTSQKEKLEQNIKILEEYIGEPSPFSILVLLRLTKSWMNEKNYKTIKENSGCSRSECNASAGCSEVDCCSGR